MTYDFINIARLEPDLNDAISFIQKPLNIIHELQSKLEKFSIGEKTSTYNLEVSLKIDKILSYYLPNIFNNYTKLSLEYRNKKVLKVIKNKELTAKDILLIDLGKVSEEIKVIEKEFNDTNKIHLLANNRIISNIGYQQSFLSKENNSIQYENEFNYDEFIKQNDVIFNKKDVNIVDNIDEPDDFQDTEKSTLNISLIEVLLIMGFILLTLIGVFTVFSKVTETNKFNTDIQKIVLINEQIKTAYAGQINYKGLNTEIASLNLIPDSYKYNQNKEIITNSGWTLDYTAKENSDNFIVSINNVDKLACLKLVNVIKSENSLNNQACNLDSNNLNFEFH